MINDYENWAGTRPDLISIIKIIEKDSPKKYKMFSKQVGKLSSINDRRVQQFIDEGIIPKPFFKDKKYQYNFTHIVRYLSAIILRNKGFPLKIVKEQLDQNDFKFFNLFKLILRLHHGVIANFICKIFKTLPSSLSNFFNLSI